VVSRRATLRIVRNIRFGVWSHVYSEPDNEVGGFLFGKPTSSGLPFVTQFHRATRASRTSTSVTFTHDAWADAHAFLDSLPPDTSIVGWYHSHPGFGIFLSEHDLFIHRNFFCGPQQFALVVDPHAHAEGIFGWVGGKIDKVYAAPVSDEFVRATSKGERPGL
jgi:proteasome lid subunit RPN8/RPN11